MVPALFLGAGHVEAFWRIEACRVVLIGVLRWNVKGPRSLDFYCAVFMRSLANSLNWEAGAL